MASARENTHKFLQQEYWIILTKEKQNITVVKLVRKTKIYETNLNLSEQSKTKTQACKCNEI